MKRFIVGSTYFFNCYEDFKSKDKDYAVIVDNPKGVKYTRQTMYGSYDVFENARRDPIEMLVYTLKAGLPMRLNVWLIPEFAKEIGVKIEDLSILSPLVAKLDNKHKYLEVIYNAYIENKDFILTDAQRLKAYEVYKEARGL